jgi:hypothetical protein
VESLCTMENMGKSWVLEIDDDGGVFRTEPATVIPSTLARLYANPVAQAEIAAALNVDDPNQQYRKRIPHGERTSPDQRSVPLTAAERRKLRPA